MDLKLFIFHDDVEEIMVAAKDREDAFTVVDEAYGEGVADDLILSYLDEYPPDMQVMTGGLTAAQVAAAGRRIVEHLPPWGQDNWRMIKPPREARCDPCLVVGNSTASPTTSTTPTTGAPPTGASG